MLIQKWELPQYSHQDVTLQVHNNPKVIEITSWLSLSGHLVQPTTEEETPFTKSRQQQQLCNNILRNCNYKVIFSVAAPRRPCHSASSLERNPPN